MLRSLPREPSFDCVIADPPYNHGIWRNEPVADYAAWCEEWLRECMARLRPGGLLYCYGWPETLAHVAVRFPVKKQRWLQWHYTNKAVPKPKFWQRAHESILALWDNPPQFLTDQIRIPYTEKYLQMAGNEYNGDGSRYSNSGSRVPLVYEMHPNGAMPRDVICEPALAGGAKANAVVKSEHPTQKPANVTKWLLRAILPNDQTGDILIPFAGSGSECMVAQSMGHRYLGIELDEQWVRLARETLAATEPML